MFTHQSEKEKIVCAVCFAPSCFAQFFFACDFALRVRGASGPLCVSRPALLDELDRATLFVAAFFFAAKAASLSGVVRLSGGAHNACHCHFPFARFVVSAAITRQPA